MAVAGESLRLNPAGVTARLVLIAGHDEQSQFAEAREVGKRLLASEPTFSLKQFAERQPYKDGADIDGFVARLNSAGLPA